MLFRGQGKGLAVAAILLGMCVQAKAGDVLYASLGDITRSPIGWVEFCAENPGECRGGATQPRDIVMSQTAWRDLVRVNQWVNETVKPMTDMLLEMRRLQDRESELAELLRELEVSYREFRRVHPFERCAIYVGLAEKEP